ncbi:hypothetical protein [Ruminococcus sp.]|uniref:hypothetical protein n=1 Tax=Ruminococcus sp. TaxID=41978 RepID=UPI00388E54CB
MIKKDFYQEREDGVKLYRAYSDRSMKIQQDGSGEIYDEAIDVENSGNAYTETDVPIEDQQPGLTVEDTLTLLGELGVDTDDQ